MIPLRLEIHGFSKAYASTECFLDFGILAPGVYAWCGPNGAGKTTAMGAITAALYRIFPGYDYPAIKHVAEGVRGAAITLEFELAGETYRARILCDPQFSGGRGKTEHYLDQWDNQAAAWKALAGPLVRDVDGVLAELLPTLAFWLSGPMAAQGGGGGFWRLSSADRKSILVELLGHGRLRVLHAAAAEVEKATTLPASTSQRQLDEVRELHLRRAALINEQAPLLVAVQERREALQAFEVEARVLEDAVAGKRTVLEDHRAELRSAARLAELERDAAEEVTTEQAAAALVSWGVADNEAKEIHLTAEAAAREVAATRASLARCERELAALEQRIATADAMVDRLAGVDLTLDICRKCPLTAAAQEAHAEATLERPEASDTRIRASVLRGELEAAVAMEAAARADDRTAADRRATLRAAYEMARDASSRSADKAQARAELAASLPDLPIADRTTQYATELAAAGARVTAHRQRVSTLLEAAREAERELARVEAELAHVNTNLAGRTVAELEVRVARERRLARAAQLLTVALGPNGVQALELGAAAPGVSEQANALLQAAYGSRFAIRLETLRPYASKEGNREVFDCVLIDNEAGSSSHAGSGGEMVIAEEALRLALCIYSTEQGGKECRTLFRDEAAGALDQWPGSDAAGRYLAMLRAARVAGGFHQVHFIAHQPALFEAADGRFIFERGGARYEEG